MPQNPNDALWDPRPRLGGHPESPDAEAESPLSVLVELAPSEGQSEASALTIARALGDRGFDVDEEYGAVPLGSGSGQTLCVRGVVPGEETIPDLESDPRVLRVWRDTKIAPF